MYDHCINYSSNSGLHIPGLQHEAYQVILRHCLPSSAALFFETSLSRWFPQDQCKEYASHLIKICQYLKGKDPPCVSHALFTMWCNGWPTRRRYQCKDSQCLLQIACDASSEDSIEHYSTCSAHWRVFRDLYGCAPTSLDLKSFLLISIPADPVAVAMALHVYAVFSLTNLHRHNCLHVKPAYNITASINNLITTATKHSKHAHSVVRAWWQACLV